MNDGEEVSLNSLNMICSPVNYFMGICQDDKEMAYEILREDTFPPPLIIDIEGATKKEISKYCLLPSGTPIVMLKKCLKLMENQQIFALSGKTKQEYYKQKNTPELPPKLYKQLIGKLDQARREESNARREVTPQFIQKFRQAFFDIIIELFLNYKQRIETVNGETQFSAQKFIADTDVAYHDFFIKFF